MFGKFGRALDTKGAVTIKCAKSTGIERAALGSLQNQSLVLVGREDGDRFIDAVKSGYICFVIEPKCARQNLFEVGISCPGPKRGYFLSYLGQKLVDFGRTKPLPLSWLSLRAPTRQDTTIQSSPQVAAAAKCADEATSTVEGIDVIRRKRKSKSVVEPHVYDLSRRQDAYRTPVVGHAAPEQVFETAIRLPEDLQRATVLDHADEDQSFGIGERKELLGQLG